MAFALFLFFCGGHEVAEGRGEAFRRVGLRWPVNLFKGNHLFLEIINLSQYTTSCHNCGASFVMRVGNGNEE